MLGSVDSDTDALTFWANVQTEAIRQAWRESTGDKHTRLLAVAERLDLPPTLIEHVLFRAHSSTHTQVITDVR